MYVSPRGHDFDVKVIKNGRWKGIKVWSGNNGCHISQAKVIKFMFALHPSIPDSCGV